MTFWHAATKVVASDLTIMSGFRILVCLAGDPLSQRFDIRKTATTLARGFRNDDNSPTYHPQPTLSHPLTLEVT